LLLEGNQIDFTHHEDGQSYIDKLDNGPLAFRVGPSYETRMTIFSAGIEIAPATPFGYFLVDNYLYDGQTFGNYSLGWYPDSWTATGPTMWLGGYGGMKFFTAGVPRMSIVNYGHVGIGTTTPQQELHIKSGSGAADIRLEPNDPTKSWNISALNDDGTMRIAWYDGSTYRDMLGLDYTGDVAIGYSLATVDGALWTFSETNKKLTGLTRLTGYPEHGYMVVFGDDVGRAGMYVDDADQGAVWADRITATVKNFRLSNPDDPATDIYYACPEGPEAAAYVRGTARLVDGSAVVELPRHFAAVASEQGMTVQLTPHSAESMGLAAVERSTNRIVVRELAQGKGNYDFDFYVMAVRKGFEDYEVVRPKSNSAPDGYEPPRQTGVDR
jgi:hypothetical protein